MEIKLWKVSVLVCLIWFADVKTFATDKCGSVCDETWSVAGSPYIVTCDVTVASSCSLGVDAGVTVQFQPGTGLIVDGDLTVSGATGSVAVFTSSAARPARGDWRSVELRSGATGSITGADISYATLGVQGTFASIAIDGCTIRESSSVGVQASGGTLGLTDSVLLNNYYGVHAVGGAAFMLSAVDVSGSYLGLYIDGASDGTLTGVAAHACTYGLYAYAGSTGQTAVDVTASSFTENYYGIWVQGVDQDPYVNPAVVVSASSLHDNVYDYYATGFRDAADSVLPAGGNWWGTTDAGAIAAKVYDRKNDVSSPVVDWCQYLNGPAPGGTLAHDSYCPDVSICDAAAWNATDRPYLVTSTVTVCPTGTLDIGPGVTVHSVNASAIRVRGALNVNGTQAAPVSLTSGSATPARGDWAGLQFLEGSTGSVAWADIAYATRGVESTASSVSLDDCTVRESSAVGVQGSSSSLTIDGCTIRESSAVGVQASGGTLGLTDSVLLNNYYGVHAVGGAAFMLSAVDVSGSYLGLYIDGASDGTLASVAAHACTYGLYVYAGSTGQTAVDVTASSFTENYYGIWVQGVDQDPYVNPAVVVSASSLHDNVYDYYATGFSDPENAELWAADCWWGTADASQIAASIFDHDDSPDSPRVITRAFGSSCDVAIGRDSDNDSFGDFEDNCPAIANPGQGDLDGDGMGDGCDPEAEFVPTGACNGIDDVTDGYVDSDGDGWGDPCEDQPMRADSYPGAPELCDGRDNDGDLEFADGERTDLDRDGAVGCVSGGGDCDDANPAVFPCACERCANLVDDDCDGAIDGADVACAERPYCVILSGTTPLGLRMNKGPCDGATSAGPYDVIRGFTTNLGFAGGSVDLGEVACASSGVAFDRLTDVSEDADPECNDGSVFWLARPTGAATFGASSAGQPRDVSNPDPVCP